MNTVKGGRSFFFKLLILEILLLICSFDLSALSRKGIMSSLYLSCLQKDHGVNKADLEKILKLDYNQKTPKNKYEITMV